MCWTQVRSTTMPSTPSLETETMSSAVPTKVVRNSVLGAGLLAAAAAFIAPHEGLRQEAYYDPVGILTVCYGHTGPDVKKGLRYSEEQCQRILKNDIQRHAEALDCIKTPLTEHQKVAFVSFAFNIGTTKFCKSTLVKKANAGDMKGACKELDKWVYGKKNGKMVKLPGLVKRRAQERQVCEMDF